MYKNIYTDLMPSFHCFHILEKSLFVGSPNQLSEKEAGNANKSEDSQ